MPRFDLSPDESANLQSALDDLRHCPPNEEEICDSDECPALRASKVLAAADQTIGRIHADLVCAATCAINPHYGKCRIGLSKPFGLHSQTGIDALERPGVHSRVETNARLLALEVLGDASGSETLIKTLAYIVESFGRK